MTKRVSGWTVGALLALWLAFVGRTLDLGGQSFWYDEGYTVMFARNDPLTIVAQAARLELNTPLHYLTLHAWMVGAGQSEFSTRLLSVFAGVVTVALGGALIRQAARNTLHAATVMGMFILGLWPVSIHLSRETRMYSLAICLAVLSVVLLLKALRSLDTPAPKRRWAGLWWGWAAASIAAFGTHVLCAFLFAGQVLFILASWLQRSRLAHRRDGAWLLPLTALAVTSAIIVIAGIYLASFSAQYGTTFTDRLEYWVMLQKSIVSLFTFHLPPDEQLALPAALVGLMIVAGLVFNPPRVRVAVGIGLCAIAGMTALASITGKFAPRYPAVAAPLVIVSLSLVRLPTAARLLFGTGVIGFTLFAPEGINLAARVQCAISTTACDAVEERNEDFRGVAAFLRQHVRADETVLLVSGHFAPVFAYYYGDQGWHALPNDPVLNIYNTLHYDTVAPTLNKALADKGGAWLLLWQDLVIDPGGVVQTLLIQQAGGADFDSRDFHGLRLLHYTLNPYRRLPEALNVERLRHDNQIVPDGAARGMDALGCETTRPVRVGDNQAEVFCHWVLNPPPPQNILPFDVQVVLTLSDAEGNERARHSGLLAPVNGMPARWGNFPLTTLYRLPLPADLSAGRYTFTAQPALNGELLSPRVEMRLDIQP
ncbi:MAG: hypothetical protein RMN25_12570 [Anaerolineae bacterium]|nr:hypothetical protein [Thermoflexales bacterium]MDW8408605.1 hypothetical protein [Anaerolineae bacterium]